MDSDRYDQRWGAKQILVLVLVSVFKTLFFLVSKHFSFYFKICINKLGILCNNSNNFPQSSKSSTKSTISWTPKNFLRKTRFLSSPLLLGILELSSNIGIMKNQFFLTLWKPCWAPSTFPSTLYAAILYATVRLIFRMICVLITVLAPGSSLLVFLLYTSVDDPPVHCMFSVSVGLPLFSSFFFLRSITTNVVNLAV